jgi:hypothetical protein
MQLTDYRPWETVLFPNIDYSSGFDFLPSCSAVFASSLFLFLVLDLSLLKLFCGGETHAPETERPFLSSLISSPLAAPARQVTWAGQMSPTAKA